MHPRFYANSKVRGGPRVREHGRALSNWPASWKRAGSSPKRATMLKAWNEITLQRVQHWNASGLPGDKSSLGCRRAAPVRVAHPVTVMGVRNHRHRTKFIPAAAGTSPFCRDPIARW